MGELGGGALPLWLTITVTLTLLGLLVYNVLVNGNDGVPTSTIIGGLMGAYAGVERILKRDSSQSRGDDRR